MNKDVTTVLQFVLDQAGGQPVSKRIQLYTGLAQICGVECEAQQLLRMANSLIEADALCREFNFTNSQEKTHK